VRHEPNTVLLTLANHVSAPVDVSVMRVLLTRSNDTAHANGTSSPSSATTTPTLPAQTSYATTTPVRATLAAHSVCQVPVRVALHTVQSGYTVTGAVLSVCGWEWASQVPPTVGDTTQPPSGTGHVAGVVCGCGCDVWHRNSSFLCAKWLCSVLRAVHLCFRLLARSSVVCLVTFAAVLASFFLLLLLRLHTNATASFQLWLWMACHT